LSRLLALALWAVSSTASAHFYLDAPVSFQTQDTLGNPQKQAPCGEAGTASGVVVPYVAGDEVTINLHETVFHPGHYRVVLGLNGQADLPADPAVTPGSTACGSTVIQTNPVFPLLADGQLVHTAAFTGPQTFKVKLPNTVSCAHCTLQVVEFMSSHGAPCFYHHCVDVSIAARDAGQPDAGQADAGQTVDAGQPDAGQADAGQSGTDAGPTIDAGVDGGVDPGGTGGCSCGSTNGLSVMIIAGLVLASRAARAQRRSPDLRS
jgi:hypothetical protein